MRIAFLADIHGNRQAFEACLDHARGQGIKRYVLLGDYVGYGADPQWVVETVQALMDDGAIAIVGNHDRAIAEISPDMNPNARVAIAWTRDQLSADAQKFLLTLPMTVEDGARLYVHGDASAPEKWNYVTHSGDARVSLDATHAHTTFCGHVHVPAIYGVAPTGKLTTFIPVTGVDVPLLRQRRWLCVLGSVGQPRDGNPAACYGVLDTTKSEITYLRVPYDIEEAANRIRAAGLPDSLANRLSRGR